jgi:diamine N-acetyltransferase
MTPDFAILPPENILEIVPFLQELGRGKVPETILKERLLDMAEQNYECIGMYLDEQLIGVCGLWYQTRHYAGRSAEIDHFIISESYRTKGLGKQLMQFIYTHVKEKQCEWIELNTYVDNFPSHKFYYNEGFQAKGYHFVKTL